MVAPVLTYGWTVTIGPNIVTQGIAAGAVEEDGKGVDADAVLDTLDTLDTLIIIHSDNLLVDENAQYTIVNKVS